MVIRQISIIILLLILNTTHAQRIASCIEAAKHDKIVSIGASITEILYLLNSQDNIIALDVTSKYPKETKIKKSIGYIRNLSSEGIISTNPSLIITENDIGPKIAVEQIIKSNIDIRIIKEVQTIPGIINKIKCVGQIIGKLDDVNNIIKKEINPIIIKIEEKKKKIDLSDKKIMLILSMQGSSPVVAGRNTSGNSYIEMLGAKNIYDKIEGWKTVSAESIIEYNPDYIILPSKELHKNSNVNLIIKNKIFQKTNAGRNHAFIIDDGMAILGFGPRTIESLLKSLMFIEKSIGK